MSAGRFESPEDFVVEEMPAYEPEGRGDHTFLWVEKRLQTTEQVARALARATGVASRDVGYAGRKDRFAVTRQYFSVPGLDVLAAKDLALPGASVLRAVAHRHKLRTGHLKGNRFSLRVHGLSVEVLEGVGRRASALEEIGLPNRFGPQRFGRDGGNPEQGRRLLAGESLRVDRREARFLVSALQARVFDEVLRARPLPLERVEPGDLARKTDTGGLFLVEDAEVENVRAARFEISATGPIFGTRMEQPGGAVAARERDVMLANGIDPESLRPPKGVRMRGARRPLRVPVRALALEVEDDRLTLGFELPAGSYATVVLEELLGSVPEAVSSRA